MTDNFHKCREKRGKNHTHACAQSNRNRQPSSENGETTRVERMLNKCQLQPASTCAAPGCFFGRFGSGCRLWLALFHRSSCWWGRHWGCACCCFGWHTAGLPLYFFSFSATAANCAPVGHRMDKMCHMLVGTMCLCTITEVHQHMRICSSPQLHMACNEKRKGRRISPPTFSGCTPPMQNTPLRITMH